MVLKINHVKKFNIKELKAIIKKHSLGRIGGRKPELVARIINHQKWLEIKNIESLPVRAKKVFSEKQLAAQQAFKDRVKKNKVIDKVVRKEVEVVRDEAVKQINKRKPKLKKILREPVKQVENLDIKLEPMKKIIKVDMSNERRKTELAELKQDINELRKIIVRFIL